MKCIKHLLQLLCLVVFVRTSGAVPPSIIVQPQDQTNLIGSTVTFNVEAAGTEPLNYQWRAYPNLNSFTNIPGATQTSLALSNIQATAVRFAALVSNGEGAVTSRLARLTVVVPPPPQLRFELLGTHPTSPLTAYPAIHALKAFEGRIYLGYGDVNLFPAVVVASFDPASNAFHVEFSINSDSIGVIREVGGVLYMPSTDPVLYADFRDYSYRAGGVWRDASPLGVLHAFDFATLDGSDLWLMGSKSPNETDTYGAAVFRSTDGGHTWTELTIQSALPEGRYYYGFALRGRFYVRDTYYTNNSDGVMVGTRTAPAPYQNLRNQTRLGEGANEFLLTVRGYSGGIERLLLSSLVTYDTQTWRTLRNNLFDFAMNGSNVITLESNAVSEVWMGSAITPSQATWQKLNFTNVPPNPQSIEVLNGVVYIGDSQGRLWGSRLDTNAINPPPATVVNEMTDDFGRALSFDGDVLAVGAPDQSGAAPLGGQVTIWEHEPVEGSDAWRRTAIINPPVASFSGWFGKDLALKGDVLAVVEAGRDLARNDRGNSAQVHLYEHSGENWVRRRTLDHPNAQSVALDSGWMAVGATNSLFLYSIVRGAAALEVTLRTNFTVAPAYFNDFQALARVAIGGDACAFGVVADVGGNGGAGEVRIYQRDDNGLWSAQQVLRSDSPIPPGRISAWHWMYDAASGVWHADGQQADLGARMTSRLNSPPITVSQAGAVQLSFLHRWSFEPGLDGGQVRVSINGSPYNAVLATAFTQNGYNGSVLADSTSELHGQSAFINQSAGHSGGTRVASTCSLGSLNASDTVSIEFLYGGDNNTRGTVPNWEIDSVTLTVAGSPFRSEDFNSSDGGYTVDTQPALALDRFGFSIALQNGWLAVGAPRDDRAALQAGAVHLYERSNSLSGAASFVLRQTLLSPLNQREAAFGASVALKGATLLVGCPGAEVDGRRHHGALFVFRREQTSWNQVAQVVRPSGSQGEFGNTVALGSKWLAAASRFSEASTGLVDRVTVWRFGPTGGGFSALRRGAEGFELTACGELGGTYKLEATSDLATPNWSELFPFTLRMPNTNLVDSAATGSQRFYRLRSNEPDM